MKFQAEFRDPAIARSLLDDIHRDLTRPWVIMEICGGQTHAIVRSGLDQLLPRGIELVHGPGCPVCVTPVSLIDRAINIALTDDTVLATYGDMLRVLGSRRSLLSARADGADVRMVYSPLNALAVARREPEKKIVFFSVGFETTAPNGAMAIRQAAREGLENFSVLSAHVLVPPAIEALLAAPANRVQGFLLAGHVCAVTGWRDYESIARAHATPMAVTGFEPIDLLGGIRACLRLLESGQARIENEYSRAVTRDGNAAARNAMEEVFEVEDREWRGIGTIPASGLRIRSAFAQHDADRLFDRAEAEAPAESPCISGEILTGAKKPFECPAFGAHCTPHSPLGATMVSSEGACAAYFAYQRRLTREAL